MPKATATHKIVATVGKYNDRTTGEEKKRYLTVGTAFTDDQGRISLKLEAMPVTPEWSGWLSLYPLDEDPAGNWVVQCGRGNFNCGTDVFIGLCLPFMNTALRNIDHSLLVFS